jgi:hypothetical protein
MTRINDLKEEDFKEFVKEMVELDGLDWALKRIYENSRLSESISFNRTKRGHEYWSNIYHNGYQIPLSIKEIENKLGLAPGTLRIVPF